ncbi:hypothetical protein S14_196 [Shewanella sp. phage 1/4]|uniref:hypothetical protein n=1 Tax=Shewanella phage 1/4 TaxID=1458859 RepID=UPI0004F79F82|nr:hypothetical protein S14_196 [Shewanella sp. phage 1/4]AHK11305.1 hypothetical protein S14_196 [Shewanella sp. phage 1/4]
MAMNKKEKLHLDSLQNEIRILRRTIEVMVADKTTHEVLPDLVPPDLWGDLLIKGYSFNSHTGMVMESCSSTTGHNKGRNDKTQCQGSIRQYSTELLAYKGLRYEVEQKWLNQLADIDNIIYKLEHNTVSEHGTCERT